MSNFSPIKQTYIEQGKKQSEALRKRTRKNIGVDKSKVESKRHSILTGPPGVGKTWTVIDELVRNNCKYIQFGAGTSDSAMALQLAYAVSKLGPKDELIVLLDDADDIVFGDEERANKFKLALAKDNPFYSQDVNMTNQRASYEKAGRTDLVEAIDRFTVPGKVGIQIPTDQVRFVIICNRDCEDPKSFPRNVRRAADAIVDRVKYQRLEFDWHISWGWLTYILDTTQPFENVSLTKKQKVRLCNWMWDHWQRMRNQSYRTVEEMAEYMINEPDDYEDIWETTFLRKQVKIHG